MMRISAKHTGYLQRIEDNSLAGITAFHTIEHFPHDYLVEILSLGYQKLAPGGFLLLETLNPYCFESLEKMCYGSNVSAASAAFSIGFPGRRISIP